MPVGQGEKMIDDLDLVFRRVVYPGSAERDFETQVGIIP
jgi:hypothetical protein